MSQDNVDFLYFFQLFSLPHFSSPREEIRAKKKFSAVTFDELDGFRREGHSCVYLPLLILALSLSVTFNQFNTSLRNTQETCPNFYFFPRVKLMHKM